MTMALTAEELAETAASGPRPNWTAVVVMLSSMASQSVAFCVPPLLPAIAASLGNSGAFAAQMVMAMPSLGLLIASFCSGPVLRLTGLRRLMILSISMYGLAGIVPVFLAAPAPLFISRLFVGLGSGFLSTCCTVLLTRSFFGAARGRMMGFQASVGSTTGLVALMAAGSLVNVIGWQAVFLMYGVFALPVLACILVSVPRAEPAAAAAHAEGFMGALRRVWPVCVGGCLLMMVPMIAGSQAPFLLHMIGVTAPTMVAMVTAMVTLFSAISGSLFGTVRERIGANRTFALGLVCAGLGMALMGMAQTVWISALGSAFVGMAVGLYVPHLLMTATGRVPAALRGHAVGLLNTAMFLGGFIFPFIVAGMQPALGLRGVFVFIAGLAFIGAVLMTFRPLRGHALETGAAAPSL